MRDFKKLLIWQKGMEVVSVILKLIEEEQKMLSTFIEKLKG
ncbi:MAG TPA: hypothetical protein VFU05_08015 [Cyclobacteriaceae bacterium]|nr:hypothetical protein [Cyclobacteriaceae bacterium]